MLNSLESLTNSEITKTQNGANAYSTTDNSIVDFFFSASSMRKMNKDEIIYLFAKALECDPLIAIKVLFYVRDIREGLGERRIFKILINYLITFKPQYIVNNLKHIPEYGRWDDLTCLLTCMNVDIVKDVVKIIDTQLIKDVQSKNPSLLAKWMPTENCSNKERIKLARILMNKLGLSNIVYRKIITNIRKKLDLIETKLTKKDYTSIDYNTIPSIANKKYHKAFKRNDTIKYEQHLENVLNGKENAKVNASVLYPYQIVSEILKRLDFCRPFDEQFKVYSQVMWNNLKDIQIDEELNTLCVVDTSGSMTSDNAVPLSSAIALALLFSSKFNGVFKDCFITFSNKPRFVKIPTELDIVGKVQYIMKYEEVANTNIEATFDLLLKTAIENKLKQSDMPNKIIIISDMEFDNATEDKATDALFLIIKNEWKYYGYELPYITFWNVSTETDKTHYPVKESEYVQFVSGHSQNIFKSIATNKFQTPMETILEIINSDRYSNITI